MEAKHLTPQVSTVDLVLQTKFYEGTAFDYSLNGNDGTASGATYVDRGYIFDGADDLVTVTADSTIDINGKTALTVSAWINVTSDGEANFGRIVDKRNVGAAGYEFNVLGEAASLVKMNFLLEYDGAAEARADTLSAVIPLNIWSHVAAVFNEDSAAKVKLYYNGTIQTLDTDSAGIGNIVDDSAVNLIIGNRTDGDRTFDGDISDVLIFSSAKSAAQIKSIYEVTRGRYSA